LQKRDIKEVYDRIKFENEQKQSYIVADLKKSNDNL